MKTANKISVLSTLFVGIMVLTFNSCTIFKRSEFSCSCSKTDLLTQKWKVDKYKINGGDYTSKVADYNESYNADGTYTYSWGMLGGCDKWEFKNNDTEIIVKGTCDEPTEIYHVIKLEDKKLWYYYMDGKDKKEIHLVSNN